MNQPSPNLVATELEKLNNLFYLMVGLPLLAFAWVYLNLKSLMPSEFFVVPAFRPLMHGAILLFSLLLAVFAFVQYRRRLKAHELNNLEQESVAKSVDKKVQLFKEASLLKYILLTCSTLLMIGGLYFSAEQNYAAAYSILLIVFSINRPTPERMVKDLGMKKEERELVFSSVRQRHSAGPPHKEERK